MTSPAFLLELLNGGAITPDLIWLCMLATYLVKESRRRGLHPLDWFSLPPSMNLILAVFVCDAGNCLRSIIIWTWRVGGAGEFSPLESAGLVVAGALIALGGLCKVRAWTQPDYGNGPWLAATALTAAVVGTMFVMMLVFR